MKNFIDLKPLQLKCHKQRDQANAEPASDPAPRDFICQSDTMAKYKYKNKQRERERKEKSEVQRKRKNEGNRSTGLVFFFFQEGAEGGDEEKCDYYVLKQRLRL